MLVIVQNSPPEVIDGNAVYLLSGVIPAGTLTDTSGAVSLSVSGTLTCQAGGAAVGASRAGVMVRQSVGGVPTVPFPLYSGSPFMELTETSGIDFFLQNSAIAQTGFNCTWGFINGGFGPLPPHPNVGASSGCISGQYGNAGFTAFGGFDNGNNLDNGNIGLVDPTQEMLIQLCLVQDDGTNHCIAPLNYLPGSWTPNNAILYYAT